MSLPRRVEFFVRALAQALAAAVMALLTWRGRPAPCGSMAGDAVRERGKTIGVLGLLDTANTPERSGSGLRLRERTRRAVELPEPIFQQRTRQ